MPREGSESGTTDRRKFLKAAAIPTAAALAGCSGGGDGGDGGSDGGDGEMTEGDGEMTEGDGGGGAQTTTAGTDWPTEPMTWVVPYGTAGGYNFYTRLVAKYIEQKDYLPVQQNVENITGAGGIVAANQVYNSDPDGYTNMIINTESFSVAQLSRDVQYDIADFTYYARIAGTTRTIAVSTQTDITTGEELLEETQAGNLKYGSQGRLGDTALMVIFLGELSGMWTTEEYYEMNVPFEERGNEVTAIKNGDIDVMTGSYSSLLPFVESGDLRPVLLYTDEDSCPESAQNADCDTFATVDTEIENADQIRALSGGPFHRIFGGPPDVPEERANKIREALDNAINDDDLRAEAQEADRPITYGDAETTRQGAEETIQAYKDNEDLLRKAGLIE